MRQFFRLHVPALALALALAGCGGDNGPSPTFVVRITDSPFSDARAVLVTFSEVSVHKSGGDFTTVPFSPASPTRTCDLKKLVGAQDVLGTAALGEGHYTEIRLVISSVTLYWDNPASGAACAASIAAPAGSSASVDVPSGEVRLNREFDVPAAGATTLTLDFDGDRSIHQTGSGRYLLTPVISVASVQ